MSTKLKFYTCKTCDKVFSNLSTFRRHEKTHLTWVEQEFQCYTCSLGFRDKTSFDKHKKSIKHTLTYAKDACAIYKPLPYDNNFIIIDEMKETKKRKSSSSDSNYNSSNTKKRPLEVLEDELIKAAAAVEKRDSNMDNSGINTPVQDEHPIEVINHGSNSNLIDLVPNLSISNTHQTPAKTPARHSLASVPDSCITKEHFDTVINELKKAMTNICKKQSEDLKATMAAESGRTIDGVNNSLVAVQEFLGKLAVVVQESHQMIPSSQTAINETGIRLTALESTIQTFIEKLDGQALETVPQVGASFILHAQATRHKHPLWLPCEGCKNLSTVLSNM